MLGPIMNIKVSSNLNIKLAPFSKEDVRAFIEDGGMQKRSVTRYINLNFAPSLETEQEWYDKTVKDPTSLVWGIWDNSSDKPKLIGNTALTKLEEFPVRRMTSGSVIFNTNYWGRGIATAIHKARTWYGFKEMNLAQIKSAVATGNIASKKALEKSGYFYHSTDRNEHFTNGSLRHLENLECLNPSKIAWDNWWGDDEPTSSALAAKVITEEALQWAEDNVTLA